MKERWSKWASLYDPKKCFSLSGKIKGIAEAITLPSKTLGQLGKEAAVDFCLKYYGEENIKKMSISQQKEIVKDCFPESQMTAFIKIWIIDLCANVNTKQTLSEPQMDFIAQRLYDKWTWKLTDLTLFFRNVKDGVYGSFFENLSPEKLIQWAEEYHNERAQVAETLSESSAPFSVNKDKMHPEVFNALFYGVEERKAEQDKKRQEEAKNSLNSYETHLEQLQDIASNASDKQRISFIKYNISRKDLNEYVIIFIESLRTSESKSAIEFLKIIDAYQDSIYFYEETTTEENAEKLNNLIEQIKNF